MKQRGSERPAARVAALAMAVVLAVGGMIGGTTAAADDSALLDSFTPVEVSGTTYTSGLPEVPFTVSASNAMVKGQPIVITGTGYLHTDGTTGSVAAFLVDAERSGDPNTLYTTREVTHPVTGAVSGDKRLHALVQAKADGTWSAEIPWPNETNTVANGDQAARDAAFFAENWKAGTTHSVRILTGSQLTNDHQRGASIRFTVVDNPVGPIAQDPEIALIRTTVEQADHAWFTLTGQTPGSTVDTELINSADAVVASASFEIGSNGRIVNKDGQTYERVTVPRTAAPGQYRVRVASSGVTRVVSEAFTVTSATTRIYNPGDHAKGTEDLLVQQGGTWTFRATNFAPNGTLRATAVIGGVAVTLASGAASTSWQLDAKGDVGLVAPDYARVRLPANAPVGELEVTFSDGTNAVTRTLTVEAPVPASVQVASSVLLGGKIRVTGEGFLHPTVTEQGSRIAVKIDEGSYPRLDTNKVHSNLTIWYIIDAESDGTFAVDIPMPDGTTSGAHGSAPALTTGVHTLRFLTGSLLSGDTSRSVQSAEFTVTAPPPPAPKKVTVSTPSISGTKKVGKTLKATVKTKTPSTAKLSYQWLRDGKKISKATKSSYKLTKSDAGKKISVKVTGTKTGYTSASKTSKTVTVAKVKSTVKVTSLKSVKRGKKATLKVTIGSAVSKPTGTVKVTVNGKTVKKTVKSSAKGKVSITLPAISKKGSYKVKASFSPSGSTAKSTSKSSTVTKTLKIT